MRHIEKFSFRFATLEDLRLIIKDLKNSNATGGDIPLKLLKECNFINEKLTNCINNSLSEALFPDSFKRANITPQGLTITIKSPYVITYVRQTFGVRDVRGQVPKTM